MLPRAFRSPVAWSLAVVVAGLAALVAGAGFVSQPPVGEAQTGTATATASATATTTTTASATATASATPTPPTIRIRKLTTGGRAVPDVATTVYEFRLTCADGTDATASAKSGETVTVATVTAGTTCQVRETQAHGSRRRSTSSPGTTLAINADRTYTVTNGFGFNFDVTMRTTGAGPIFQSSSFALARVSLRLACTVGSGDNAQTFTRDRNLFVAYQSIALADALADVTRERLNTLEDYPDYATCTFTPVETRGASSVTISPADEDAGTDGHQLSIDGAHKAVTITYAYEQPRTAFFYETSTGTPPDGAPASVDVSTVCADLTDSSDPPVAIHGGFRTGTRTLVASAQADRSVIGAVPPIARAGQRCTITQGDKGAALVEYKTRTYPLTTYSADEVYKNLAAIRAGDSQAATTTTTGGSTSSGVAFTLSDHLIVAFVNRYPVALTVTNAVSGPAPDGARYAYAVSCVKDGVTTTDTLSMGAGESATTATHFAPRSACTVTATSDHATAARSEAISGAPDAAVVVDNTGWTITHAFTTLETPTPVPTPAPTPVPTTAPPEPPVTPITIRTPEPPRITNPPPIVVNPDPTQPARDPTPTPAPPDRPESDPQETGQEDTPTPDPSDTPEPSATPGRESDPRETGDDDTVTPDPSDTPEPSATPDPVSNPRETGREGTATPDPSATPQPDPQEGEQDDTGTPDPSGTPEPSATPEAESGSRESEQEGASTPEPSGTPEPTGTPGPVVVTIKTKDGGMVELACRTPDGGDLSENLALEAGEERAVPVAPGSSCTVRDPANGEDAVDLGPIEADRVVDLEEVNGNGRAAPPESAVEQPPAATEQPPASNAPADASDDAPAPPSSGTGVSTATARALVWPGAVLLALAVAVAVVRQRRAR